MELKFNDQQAIAMIRLYYHNYEGKNVSVTASRGKTVNHPRYMPVRCVGQYIVREIDPVSGKEGQRPLDFGQDELEKAISTYLSNKLDVSEVKLTTTGIAVVGEEKKKGEFAI